MLFEIASPMVSVVWEKIQKENQCCGLAGQNDWIDSDFQKIPETCCNSGKASTRWRKMTDRNEASRLYSKFEIFDAKLRFALLAILTPSVKMTNRLSS